MLIISLFLGIIQFLFIASILVYELKNKSSSVFLWGTLIIMFGIPHLMSSYTGDKNYSNMDLSSASLFVIGFCLIYIIFRMVLARRIVVLNRERLEYENISREVQDNSRTGKTLFFVLLAVVILKLIPVIRSAGGILNTSWGSGRLYTSELSYTSGTQVYSILCYSLSGIIVYYWIKRERVYFILTLLVYISEVIITRNRIEVLPILCGLIIIPLLKNKRISLKMIILGSLGMVGVIYFVYALWVFRHYGSLTNFVNSFSLTDFVNQINDHLRNDTDNGELNYRKWFYYYIQNNNNFPNFNRAHSYIRMLLVYIPTQWSLGLKPPDFAISMGAAIGMAPGGSMHPTLFGDCYANLNYFGILLGAFWALYVTIADKLTIKGNPLKCILIFSLNSVAFVIIGRGSVYNPFFYVAYGVPLILLCEYLREHVRIRKSNAS